MDNNLKVIDIMYHDEELEKIKQVEGSDWIDLRAAETVTLEPGEFKLISLGVSMKLPDGYEAHMVPRSSTFKNYGIIQTNHCGIIDNTYCSSEDIWKLPIYATRRITINKNDRICQFRIVKSQPTIVFNVVNELNNKSRGGFGSTGIK